MECGGKSLLLENRYLMSFVLSSEFDERKIPSTKIKRGRFRRSAKLFALHLQCVRGITN